MPREHSAVDQFLVSQASGDGSGSERVKEQIVAVLAGAACATTMLIPMKHKHQTEKTDNMIGT